MTFSTDNHGSRYGIGQTFDGRDYPPSPYIWMLAFLRQPSLQNGIWIPTNSLFVRVDFAQLTQLWDSRNRIARSPNQGARPTARLTPRAAVGKVAPRVQRSCAAFLISSAAAARRVKS
jgi:hypothetical protein